MLCVENRRMEKSFNGSAKEKCHQSLSLVVNAYNSNVGTGIDLISTDYFKEVKIFLK